ncbi:MAG TPA: sulfonate ABC transporter substrate-binding protein [Stellaceae bacterium]|nr:sulfonate ABC transporter substrate-binding protein [Stellaceae bacterium]
MTYTKGILSFVTLLTAAIALAGTSSADGPTLRIGVQKYGTLVVVRAQQGLEHRLQHQVSSIEWTEFPAGPQLLEAMAAGSIDFGTTGEAPPIFAQAGGKGLVYVGVERPAPKGEAILVPKDSPIQKIAELKGKKVALNKGSNVHYLLVRALASAGLTPADIESVYLAPADARAAFERGAVDAWAIWDPYLSAAEAATSARELTNGEGLVANRQFYLASPKFAQAQPALVRAILDEIDRTDAWAATHVNETAEQLSPATGLSVPVLQTALGRLPFGAGPVDDGIVHDQQQIADTFYGLGLIPKPIVVRDIVWTPHS